VRFSVERPRNARHVFIGIRPNQVRRRVKWGSLVRPISSVIPGISLSKSIVPRYDLPSSIRSALRTSMAHSANSRPSWGLAGSSGLATTSLAFVTAFRVKRRISEFKVICLFTFYSNKGAFAVTSSETTEPTFYNYFLGLPVCIVSFIFSSLE